MNATTRRRLESMATSAAWLVRALANPDEVSARDLEAIVDTIDALRDTGIDAQRELQAEEEVAAAGVGRGECEPGGRLMQ
jgi:hypothetical protein